MPIKWDRKRAAALLKASLAPEIRLIVEKETDPAVMWEMSFVITEFYNAKIYSDEDLSLFIARYEAAYRKVVEGEETHRIYID